jgi:hypothetical protein
MARWRRVLAAELSGLSRALWRCYTHPASTADSFEVNSEGWRREQSRSEFGSAVDHLRRPNLPDEHGYLMVSYDPVEERAHRMGRCLHHASDPDLTTAVIGDVEAELAAVERAGLGDLSGRAVQAVQLTRQDASPVQVAAANEILAKDPLGGDDLFVDLDPTSACVAAAHWLQAAADVVAEISDVEATEVAVEADDIEALPYRTPTAVLELMALGMPPTAAVTSLIREAMDVAEGRITDVDELRDRIDEADNKPDEPDPEAEPTTMRLTPLDPGRPARDMLEDLLSGIRGCWLLFQEYAELPDRPGDEADAEPNRDNELEDDDDLSDALDDALDAAFIEAVRVRATAAGHRLDLGGT